MMHSNGFRPSYVWPQQLPDLVLSLASRLRLSREEALRQGVDIAQVGLAILDVFEQWYNAPNKTVDYELQAVLACALASRWLAEDDPQRQSVYEQMLAEMDLNPPEEAFRTFSEAGVSEAVANVLGCWVKKVKGIGTPSITVTFQAGDYGRGVFDGAVILDLYQRTLTLTETGTGRMQIFTGTELPASDAELEDALASNLWRDEDAEEIEEPIDDTLCFTLRHH